MHLSHLSFPTLRLRGCFSRKQNHYINAIHERALRVVYKDYNSLFDELLEKDNSYKIHKRNLQTLVTEIFKVRMNLGPEIMKELFKIVEVPHPLRNELKIKSRKFPLLGMALKQHPLLALESGTVYPVTLSKVNPLSFSSQR